MNILVTGCSGYIGSELVSKLANTYEVYGLCRTNNCHQELSDHLNTDLRDEFQIPSNWDIDVLILNAAAGNSVRSLNSQLEINFLSQVKLVEQFEKINSNIYAILLSSASVDRVNESTESLSGYTLSKAVSETYLFDKLSRITIIRLNNVFSLHCQLFPFKMIKMLADKEKVSITMPKVGKLTQRNYVYLDNIIDVIIDEIQKPGKRVQSVFSDESYTFPELISLIEEITNDRYHELIKKEEKYNQIHNELTSNLKILPSNRIVIQNRETVREILEKLWRDYS